MLGNLLDSEKDSEDFCKIRKKPGRNDLAGNDLGDFEKLSEKTGHPERWAVGGSGIFAEKMVVVHYLS